MINAKDENRLELLNDAIEHGGIPIGFIFADHTENGTAFKARIFSEHLEHGPNEQAVAFMENMLLGAKETMEGMSAIEAAKQMFLSVIEEVIAEVAQLKPTGTFSIPEKKEREIVASYRPKLDEILPLLQKCEDPVPDKVKLRFGFNAQPGKWSDMMGWLFWNEGIFGMAVRIYLESKKAA
jgi:hypothetical protein